ncbi:MAG: carboxypeptidase-like regulatory domain-containing protein [marine benthic group bacterium]|nr:carboxypeptidase-like regulatory domain-containing protein [Candidatus Benthicola marisminoris]
MRFDMVKAISRAVLVSAFVATACSDDTPTAPPGPGSVGGIVTFEQSDGVPLQNVAVIVEGKISWTDVDGRYLIEGITPGEHELIASKWTTLDHVDTVSVTAAQQTIYDIEMIFPENIAADWRDESADESVTGSDVIR